MLRFKEDVRVGHLNASLCLLLELASRWSLLHKVDVVVNSIADSAPGRVPASLHPFDLAVDVEPLGNTQADRQSLADFYRVMLPAGFDVVFESSHVHVECDAHRPPLREIAG